LRKAFSEALTKVATENERVIFLTADMGFQVFDDFQTRFGARYVNVGIAEAQMTCAAAGLALAGWRPVIYSIAAFVTGRAFEQIRISVNYQKLPVVIVGAGGGYTYASSGVTHHAGDDFGLMSLLPGMTVVAPGDPNEVAQLFPQVMELQGPVYFRIGKYGEQTYTAEEPVLLGRARLLSDGDRVGIISTGDMASVVVDALRVLELQGIKPLAYQMHTVKPLDVQTLNLMADRVNTLIVIEEHGLMGGLGSALSLWRSDSGAQCRLLRLGPPDALVLGSPSQVELRQRLNYDVDSLVRMCRTAWNTAV